MRLRCPAKNCPIEVPDDLAGVRIRCPHCGASLVVDPKFREASAEEIQAGSPTAAREPVNLENQIYDGLPPLAVMMALRRKGGAKYDADDFNRKYEMTDDDWRALSAFEAVLLATVPLRLTVWLGAAAICANVVVLVAAITSPERVAGTDPGWLGTRAVLTVVLFACCFLVSMGAHALQRIELGALTVSLPGLLLLGVAMFLGCLALSVLHRPSYYRDDLLMWTTFLSIPLNLIAALDMAKGIWRACRALWLVRPPEISHRLIEALKYLA